MITKTQNIIALITVLSVAMFAGVWLSYTSNKTVGQITQSACEYLTDSATTSRTFILAGATTTMVVKTDTAVQLFENIVAFATTGIPTLLITHEFTNWNATTSDFFPELLSSNSGSITTVGSDKRTMSWLVPTTTSQDFTFGQLPKLTDVDANFTKISIGAQSFDTEVWLQACKVEQM